MTMTLLISIKSVEVEAEAAVVGADEGAAEEVAVEAEAAAEAAEIPTVISEAEVLEAAPVRASIEDVEGAVRRVRRRRTAGQPSLNGICRKAHVGAV